MSSVASIRRRFGLGGSWSVVAPSMLVLIIQAVVAVTAWPPLRAWGLCGEHLLGGGHIGRAVELALVCGFFGSVALVALHNNERNVAVALVVLAVLLSACLALVMLDSAAFAVRTPGDPGHDNGDMVNCPYKTVTQIVSVSYLYVVCGSAIALLLLQAARAFGHARLVRKTETSHD
jgi:hypothetical protein